MDVRRHYHYHTHFSLSFFPGAIMWDPHIQIVELWTKSNYSFQTRQWKWLIIIGLWKVWSKEYLSFWPLFNTYYFKMLKLRLIDTCDHLLSVTGDLTILKFSIPIENKHKVVPVVQAVRFSRIIHNWKFNVALQNLRYSST